MNGDCEARLENLERRVAAMERERATGVVSGWSAAARLLQVSVPTVRRRFKTNPKFPRPFQILAGKDGRIRPQWRWEDLKNFQ